MTDIVPLIPQTIAIQNADLPLFDRVVSLVVKTVAESSARVYRQTYSAWVAYATTQNIDPVYLHPDHVYAFLAAGQTTHATRKRQLSALRAVVDLLAQIDGQTYNLYAAVLKKMKAPMPEVISAERSKRALSPAESDSLLRAFVGDSRSVARRNFAIVATLLLTGMRRAELAVLQWRDVDFDRGIIHIRHGKGDKARDAAVMGDAAIEALRLWQAVQTDGFQFVFTRVLKDGSTRTDKPISTQAVQDVINDAAVLAGLDSVKPHDLRRTLITEMLSTGSPVQEAQAQAGHARGDTTLRYAQAASAEQRRAQARLRYGAVKTKP